jgi:hypothetical protein
VRISPEDRRRLDAIETAAGIQRAEMKRHLPAVDSHRDRAVIAQADARGIANSATRS